MKKLFILIFLLLLIFYKNINAGEKDMFLELKDGVVEIDLFEDVAPNTVKRIVTLVKNKEYDGVVFHRVIDGFMAQTGDVQYGNTKKDSFNLDQAGTGGSNLPDLKAEFSNVPHQRGTLSMARSQNPNSANSQFFICFQDSPHLDRNYTVFGKVVKGMEFVDNIKKGAGQNGSVEDPDKIIKITLTK
tara:strand:- start:50 stop:610 length:561 start_codon:yes stop_codon:yes gene_type:complete